MDVRKRWPETAQGNEEPMIHGWRHADPNWKPVPKHRKELDQRLTAMQYNNNNRQQEVPPELVSASQFEPSDLYRSVRLRPSRISSSKTHPKQRANDTYPHHPNSLSTQFKNLYPCIQFPIRRKYHSEQRPIVAIHPHHSVCSHTVNSLPPKRRHSRKRSASVFISWSCRH
jgi:hypothetical protein